MTGLNRMQKFGYWVPVFFWMGVIFLMSTAVFSSQNTSSIIEPIVRFLMPSLSRREVDLIHGLIRKAGHVTEYFILGILLFRAFGGREGENGIWRRVFLSVVAAALYAGSDEFHQSFVSSRTPALADVGLDTAAAVLAQAVCLLRLRLLQRHDRASGLR